MPNLLSDESLRVARLDQVGDVGVPEAVKVEGGRETDGVPVGGEAVICGPG